MRMIAHDLCDAARAILSAVETDAQRAEDRAYGRKSERRYRGGR